MSWKMKREDSKSIKQYEVSHFSVFVSQIQSTCTFTSLFPSPTQSLSHIQTNTSTSGKYVDVNVIRNTFFRELYKKSSWLS